MVAFFALLICLALMPREASARTIVWLGSSGQVPWDLAIPEDDRFEVLDTVEFASLTPGALHVADVTVPDRILVRRLEPIGSFWSLQIDVHVVSSTRPGLNLAVLSSVLDGAKQVILGVTPTQVGFVGPNGASWIGDVTFLMNTTDAIHRYDVQKVGTTIRLFIDGSASPAIELPIENFMDTATEGITFLATSIAGTSEFEIERFQVSTGLSATSTEPTRLLTHLYPPAPNPFNPKTKLRFHLEHTARLELSIYDAAGRLVRALEDRMFAAGEHERGWNGQDDQGRAVATGVYFARMKVDGRPQEQLRKLVLIK